MASQLGVPALLILAMLLAPVGWLWYRLRPVQRYEVDEMAEASGLVITSDNALIVVESIASTRLWRTVGVLFAATSLMAVAAFEVMSTQSLTVPLTLLLWGLVGYWVGSVIAELGTARTVTSEGPRSASLAPREMSRYVGGWAVLWPPRLAVGGCMSALASLVLGDRSWWLLAAGLGSVVVALVTHVVSRYVLDRPQPVRSLDVAAADDAVRSRSLHALGGTAIGIEIWLVSLAVGGTVISAIARYGPGPATEGRQEAFPVLVGTSFLVLVVFVVVLPVVGFVVGRRLTRRPFRVPASLEVAG